MSARKITIDSVTQGVKVVIPQPAHRHPAEAPQQGRTPFIEHRYFDASTLTIS